MEQEGLWTDLRHGDSLQVVTIEPFSPAYFELMRRLPEITPILERFAEVLIAGEKVSIKIADGGLTAAREIAQVVRQFRGP